MTKEQSHSDHLHAEGIINKDELTEEHLKAIDSLSKEEVEQIKKINKTIQKTSPGVGIML
ncbi:hypothetical protein [Thalassotalea marina]|uniref:Uncharacterized protein n=1 Tax=Thalassotalea marina TaxID=1673741 RepID=A0A919BMI7_9GAMM|nr:hypothetical protein [Thalassotalea marina]GHG01325.1 hypothetical protein GCM10017161_32490 [Thalassotalea marina]